MNHGTKAVCSAVYVETHYHDHASAKTESSTAEQTTKSKSLFNPHLAVVNIITLDDDLSITLFSFNIFIIINFSLST